MKPAELRVFLSSTFTDLQPEREHLIKKVFPKIRAKCRERGVEFTEIDLRWGITAEEAHTGKIVRVCLGEIARCPYFIGILGSRYGWRPGITELEKDPAMLETYPMLRGYGEANKSITEIEFAHGALYPPETGSAFIYEQVTPSQKIDPADRVSMDELKDTIRTSDLPFRSFDTPEELGDKVYNDLLFLLERDWPISAEPTPLESEQIAHRAFAFNRTRAYVATPEYTERFERFVSEDSAPLIVWGRSGLGKSALMAHLASEYERLHPDAFIVLHFVGASAGASSAADVMRRIAAEIKLRYDLPDEVQNDDAALAQEFPSWLANIRADDKLILLIDAVNQLSGIGPEMHWLPEFIPSNVRLVISTTPDTPLEELRKRNWQKLEIQPLDESARVQIATDYLASFGKKLTPEQIERVAREPKLESPLFLRTILEELRVFGVYESLEEHLASYLSSEDEHELFQHVLARMERDFGSDAVRSVMTALWASRFGLTETELLEITQLPRYALSEFLIALEFHLMQRNGLYTFFHNYLRQAVEKRYLSDDQKIKAAHRHLAHYFADSPYNSRRRDEEPWQWKEAEENKNFKDCITAIPMLEMLLDESRLQETIGYWVELQKNYDLAATYHSAMENFKAGCEDEAYFAELSGKLGNALVSASSYKEAEVHLQESVNLQKKLFGEESLKAAESMNNLSVLYYHTGNFTEAEKLLESVIAIREKILDKSDPLIAKALSDLGVIYYSQGKLDEAEKYLLVALNRYQSLKNGNHPEIAPTLGNLGAISYFRKKYDEAIDYFRKSINMDEQIYGTTSIKIIPAMGNLALAYTEIGAYEKAEPLLIRTVSLNKSTYGNYHIDTSNYLMSLGIFYSRVKNYQKAVEMQNEALEICEKMPGKDHYSTINIYISLGMNKFRNGEIQEGRKLVEFYLPILKEKLGANHQMYKVQENTWNKLMEV